MLLPLGVGSLRAESVEAVGQVEHGAVAEEAPHHGSVGGRALVREKVVHQGLDASEFSGHRDQQMGASQLCRVDGRRTGESFDVRQDMRKLLRTLGLQGVVVLGLELLVRRGRIHDIAVTADDVEDGLLLLSAAVGSRLVEVDDVEGQQLAEVVTEVGDFVQLRRCDTHDGHQPPQAVEPQASRRLLATDPVLDRVEALRSREASHLLGLKPVLAAAEEGQGLSLQGGHFDHADLL